MEHSFDEPSRRRYGVALFEELAVDPRTHVTPKGTLRVWSIAPAIFVTRTVGFVEESHADLFESYGLQCIQQNGGRKIRAFHDWLDMTGYDSKCRTRLTAWSRRHLGDFEEVHMAVRSKIVAMGVQLANLALGGIIQVYSERTRLEVEMRRVFRASPGAIKL